LVFAGLLLLDIALMIGLPFLIALYFEYGLARYLLLLLWLRTLFRFYARRKRADFSFADRMLSFLGIPLFILLLCRSWYFQRVKKQVLWKGRSYSA
jgi:predicted membrane protein